MIRTQTLEKILQKLEKLTVHLILVPVVEAMQTILLKKKLFEALRLDHEKADIQLSPMRVSGQGC